MSSIIPKSTGKAPVKSIAPTDSQSKKSSKRRSATSATGLQHKSAIKKCIKETSPDGTIKITEKTLYVLCGIAESLIEEVAMQANTLTKKAKKGTVCLDDIITSFDLMLSGELRTLCLKEIKSLVAKSKTKVSRK